MSLVLTRPTTVAQAVDDLSVEDALVLAGGQSIVLLMNAGLSQPARLVSLAEVGELRGVHRDGTTLDVGAMCTHDELARHQEIRSALPSLARMFDRVGNIRVRCAGTVGGNLVHADPAQDPPVLLAALGATATVVGPASPRDIAVEEVALGPLYASLEENEILTRIRLPIPQHRSGAHYIKFLPGTQDDYATVSIGVHLELDDADQVRSARIVAGASGPTPMVLAEAADALVGNDPTDQELLGTIGEIARDGVEPSSDRRGSADYKRAMAAVVTRRAIQACISDIATTSRRSE